MSQIDTEALKSRAAGMWPEIIPATCDIDATVLDGRHHPCPRCGGTDRFRVFSDFAETGGMNCSQCHAEKNGDGIAAVMWLNNESFRDAGNRLAAHLGIQPSRNGNGHHDVVADVASRKRVPLESWKAFGAHQAERGKLTVCRVPMFDEHGEQCSHFDFCTMDEKWLKGIAAKDLPAGLFLRGGQLPKPDEVVHLVEGPKDAAALDSLDLISVGLPTRVMNEKYARLFRGCKVIVIPDRDRDGEAGAEKTAARLAGIASSVKIAKLPGELKAKGGDGVREILARANGEATLRQALADAVEWAPPQETGTAVSNHTVETRGDKNVKVPKSMEAIIGEIRDATNNWPRRMGDALFVDAGGNIAWIENSAALGGFIGTAAGKPLRFARGIGIHAVAEVFQEFRRCATAYHGVETLPHYPIVEGLYYACEMPQPGDGTTLAKLVDHFTPETDIDRDLILAAFVTPGWGGTGKRPSFGITSDAGRGCGKTTLAKMIGRVWGGIIDIAADEPAEVVKQRLLSPEGITKRVANIDNLKSMRFSSAALESLVTQDNISGKRMYVGEASRPNNLTWITTLNGVSFATDWAQRSVIIKLQKPTYSGTWQDDVEAFIDANRAEIIADAIGFLQRPARHTLERYSRWGNWERDILSRLPEPADAQAVILDRQREADAEGEETGTFEDHVAEKLQEAHFDIKTDRVLIPSKLAAAWLSEVTGERYGTTKASRYIRQRIRDGGLKRLTENACKSYARGFVWNGIECEMDAAVKTDIEVRSQRGGF